MMISRRHRLRARYAGVYRPERWGRLGYMVRITISIKYLQATPNLRRMMNGLCLFHLHVSCSLPTEFYSLQPG